MANRSPSFFTSWRRLLVAGTFAAVAIDAAMSIAGCSSTDRIVEPNEAGDDGSVTPSDGGTDGNVIRPEGGTDATTCDMPVKGDCDLILQNCPKTAKGVAQECIVGGTSGARKTECIEVQATQLLGVGRACCPNGNGNPCLPGLTCVGNECSDGGPISGRCSPACCEGNDTACGRSEPEGIAGTCNLTLVDDKGDPLHDVCSYQQRCKPFKQEPCGAGEICIVEDKLGTAGCLQSNGKGDGQPCGFANDCADGFICVGGADAGACRYVCLVFGSVHPFDAGVEDGGPGMGGCPSGQSCRGFSATSNLPSWFGACGP